MSMQLTETGIVTKVLAASGSCSESEWCVYHCHIPNSRDYRKCG